MVVAALALDWLDDDRRDVVLVLLEGVPHLRDGERLPRLHVLGVLRVERETSLGAQHARPVELREVRRLPGIRRVRERERVARAAVEGLLEVEHLVPALLTVTSRKVLPYLPVEGRLQRVLHAQGAAPVPCRGHRVRPERLHELRHLHRVDVRVGRIVERRAQKLGREVRALHAGMVHADGIRREEGEEIQELLPVAGIEEVDPLALLEIEDEVETVGEHALRDGLVDLVGRDVRGGGERRVHERLLSG